MNSGIYKIVNKDTGKRYIGSAIDIAKRWKEHKNSLRKGVHHSILLQRAWDKYGEESFNFVLIENVEKERLISKEQIFINEKSEYNICKTAGSQFGLKRSIETRQKQSKSLKGEKHPNYGKRLSEETRKNISAGLLGNIPWNKDKKGIQIPSIETRRKMSESHCGEKNGFYGKKHSEETKSKIAEARRRYCNGA